MKVLLAADGSEPALAALGLMEAVGRRSGLTVTALSVASLSTLTPDWPTASLEAAVAKDADRARGIASAAAQRLHEAGFTAEAETAEGDPGGEIVAAVDRGGYGLTVMGSGRHRWLSSRLLGSTGTFVLHACPASVLLVHEPPPAGEECRVLVATDGSAWSRLAVSVFEGFADPERCRVVVLSVAELPPHPAVAGFPTEIMYVYPPIPLSPEAYEEIGRASRQRAEAAARTAAGRLREAGFRVEEELACGSPRSLVLDKATEEGFDLVVVGTRGLGPVRRALLGSVSEPVARHARAALVGRTETT